MIVEIISIGTELLLGDVVDTNSTYIAERLTANGYDIHYISTVGDNKTRLIQSLNRALERADIIITSGGLGPTEDDLTREAVADVTGKKLIKDPELENMINNYFHHRDYEMTRNNLKQALLPEGARPIINSWGTAPGILHEYEKGTIISLPGVPMEMKKMFNSAVIPYLKKINNKIIRSKTLHFIGIGESTLETKIIDILSKQTNPTLALLAGKGEVKLRITAKGSSTQQIDNLINKTETIIRNRVGKYIYGVNNVKITEVIGNLLRKNNMTISVAESCTGGLVGNRITNVSGSSEYFMGGLITYSNQAKIDLLNVKPTTIARHGAVSKETAIEMARGAKKVYNTDIALSLTGIAGPGGGTRHKPVGLVFIGLSHKQQTEVYQLNLKGDRTRNKWMSSQYAFYHLYEYLVNKDD